MTLGEAKNKVYMLLDEHSAGGEVEHDEDIEKKMTAFFDTAQKTLAQIRRIVREYALPLAMGKTAYEMPSDFSALYRVWADGRITRALRWRAGKLLGMLLLQFCRRHAQLPASDTDLHLKIHREPHLDPPVPQRSLYLLAAGCSGRNRAVSGQLHGAADVKAPLRRQARAAFVQIQRPYRDRCPQLGGIVLSVAHPAVC